MQRSIWRQPAVFVCFAIVLSVGWAPAATDRVSGLITRTFVIVEDTDLVGDVTCDVTGAPCFSFGARGATLRLNGFTITGKADPVTACAGAALTAGEGGIATNNQSGVVVQGPGLVQRFRQHGVWVAGSRNARVENLTAATNCGSGVFIAANAFGTLVEGITAVRNGSAAAPCGGVWIAGHNSRVRLNHASGNGFSDPANDFGIGVVGTASGNVIDNNVVTGNTQGIVVFAGARATLVRENTVLGNPPIQTATTRPDVRGLDIVNLAPQGQTTFERNLCISAVNAPCPAVRTPEP